MPLKLIKYWWKDHVVYNLNIILIETLGKFELQRSIKLRPSYSKVHKILWCKNHVVYNLNIILIKTLGNLWLQRSLKMRPSTLKYIKY